MPQKNRRLHPRAIVRRTAEMRRRGADGWEEILLYDLSAGGAGILTAASLAVQEEIRLRFDLTDQEPHKIEVDTLVVRNQLATAQDPDRPHLSGLHFLTLDSEAFDRVRSYIWDRLQAE